MASPLQWGDRPVDRESAVLFEGVRRSASGWQGGLGQVLLEVGTAALWKVTI